MLELNLTFSIAAFIAGLLMFLAPCTLPLVPAYLAFISGVKETQGKTNVSSRRKIQRNALAFVLGFSVIFISFGILAGFFGSFVGQYRGVLSQVGGVFIILFGLLMLNILHFAPLQKEHKIKLPSYITPGKASSAFVIGAIFALGWTPCIGPVLASVLLLATTKATIFSGAFLLFLFSLGLSVPFVLTAMLYAHAGAYIEKYAYISKSVSIFGGLILILIGVLLLSNNFGLTVVYGYKALEFLGIGDLYSFY